MTRPPPIGRLPFGAHRRLSRVAAEAGRTAARGDDLGSMWGARADSFAPVPGPTRWSGELVGDDERRGVLEHAVATALIGPPHALVDVLTDDATGWCPGFSFTSRSEAFRVHSDSGDSVAVHRFEADHLWWFDPMAVVEWSLVAGVDTPLLVDDDVLVEAGGGPLVAHGISLAEMRGDLIVSIHSTFDEADLIEQVLLPASEPGSSASRGA